mmetsp:Transcript_53212/g.108271  ORF Transcript_53212/g.108271 Transcript_53212/m.108271 type:complete len:84 (+) Transcript_53212:228-479(+)
MVQWKAVMGEEFTAHERCNDAHQNGQPREHVGSYVFGNPWRFGTNIIAIIVRIFALWKWSRTKTAEEGCELGFCLSRSDGPQV